MQYHSIAATDLAVSRVCLGTMTFGAQCDEHQAAEMLDLSLERGVNFVDTANVYSAGRAEEILGRLLAGRRDEVVLATKVGLSMGTAPDESGLSPAAIERGVTDSLRRLQTDYVDILYLHAPDPATPLEDSLAAVGKLVQKGLVRHLGVSNYASWQVCRLLWLAEKQNLPAVRVTQPMYNLLARGIEQEFLPMSHEFQLSTVAYNPLAGGLLTGKHIGKQPEVGTRFDRMPAYRDRYWNEANHDVVRRLAELARQSGRSLVSLSLGWLLHHTAASAVVVGASSLAQLGENLDACEQPPLSEDVLKACLDLSSRLAPSWPKYNR